MTIFGVPLAELDRALLQKFLDDAESEPLLWEAKGTTVDPRAVRRAVCGFANGLEPGYLILGAAETSKGWVLDGIQMKDEPPLWVTNVLRGGVRPLPRVETHVIESTPDGRYVVVVEVLPVDDPPCFSRGTIFERVPGATPSVKDPIRLADLYERDRAAHETARRGARLHAKDLGDNCPSEAAGPGALSVTLGLAATGYPEDRRPVLFSESFADALDRAFDGILDVPPNIPLTVPRELTSRQSGVIVRGRDSGFERGFARFAWVQATWDGVVAIHYQSAMDVISAKELAPVSVERSWREAIKLVELLGGRGDAHLHLRVDGGRALQGPESRNSLKVELERGPINLEFDQAQLGDIDRELRRSAGEVVYEATSDAGTPDAV